MNDCIEQMKSTSNGPVYGRRRVADLLNKLEYPLALNEKREAVARIECMEDSSMLEVMPDPARRGLWLLLYGRAPTVAGIINDAGLAWYLDTDSYLRELFLVQQLGRMGRISCLRRLFGLYYGEFNVEESAYSTFDFPYHTIDIDQGVVHWNACPNPKLQKFL